MLMFWAAALPFAALLGIPWTYFTRDITFLYRTCMSAAFAGVRLAGVKVRTVGLEKIDPARSYIFLSNHISNLRDAVKALDQGLNMTIYVEGKRSFDGKLLPFKKGPFYLAEECKVPVIPITISGTEAVMPKARFAIRPGTVTVEFHDPIEPADFGSRDCLMAKVRAAINSGLPPDLRE